MSERSDHAIYISSKIKEIRRASRWTQYELAKRSGITCAAVSKIEKGDRLPSIIVAKKLAVALNISVAELTGDASLSSSDIKDEAQVFFRKFGEIKNLNLHDQKMIKSIIKRLLGT